MANPCACGTCRRCQCRRAQARYQRTAKGKATLARYAGAPSGRTARARFWASARGRQTRADMNARRVFVGQTYRGRAQTAEQAEAIRAYAKERIREFISGQ